MRMFMNFQLAGITCAAVGMLTSVAAAAAPTTRPYATAHDRPLEAVESVVARADNHTKYRVEFNGIRGRVPANLYIPKGPKKQHPAVLLQYGSGGNKNTNYIVAIALKAV